MNEKQNAALEIAATILMTEILYPGLCKRLVENRERLDALVREIYPEFAAELDRAMDTVRARCGGEAPLSIVGV